MNDQFDRSLILRDHQRPIVGPLEDKIKRAKKIILALIISSFVLLIVTIIIALIPSASQNVIDENKNLKEINSQLKQKNNQLNQDLTAKKELNSNLIETKISRQSQLKLNNELIVFLQNDIKLNCNPLKQRLRFNGTNMNAFTLSVQNTNSINIPEIIFLNVSDNQLTSFSDNSLPNIEYVDLTNNPISKISNNKLDKVLQIVGVSSQSKLNEFSSNFLPFIKNMTLKNNNITIFTDNYLNSIKYLDLSSNKLTTFSNFNYGNLQFLDISLNPIVQFNGNKFQNLVQIKTIFTSPNSIVFYDNFFGKVNNLFIRYKDYHQRPTLKFTNNYFPYLTNLSLEYLSFNYSTFTTNNMPVLAHLKFYDCQFNNYYQYPELYRNVISLEFQKSSFENYSKLTYPNLTVLILNQTRIRQFSNNILPELRYLMLFNSNSQKGKIQNNNMPNLKTLYLKSLQLKDSNFIRSLSSLQYIQLKNNKNINSFDNYVFPHLTTLYFQFNQIQSFQNNSFPSLTNLTIIQSNCTINLDPFINTLEYLYIFGNIQNLKFPNLKFLRVQYSYKFLNNILSLLQELVIQGGADIESNDMPLVKRITIINSQMSTFPKKFDQTLQFLGIADFFTSEITSFDMHNMPNLQTIIIIYSKMVSFCKNYLPKATKMYLYGNDLNVFDCDGLKNVQQLNLTNNQLNDSTVDKIVKCKLPNLSVVDLSKNNISNPSYAMSLLQNAYPNALIRV